MSFHRTRHAPTRLSSTAITFSKLSVELKLLCNYDNYSATVFLRRYHFGTNRFYICSSGRCKEGLWCHLAVLRSKQHATFSHNCVKLLYKMERKELAPGQMTIFMGWGNMWQTNVSTCVNHVLMCPRER